MDVSNDLEGTLRDDSRFLQSRITSGQRRSLARFVDQDAGWSTCLSDWSGIRWFKEGLGS